MERHASPEALLGAAKRDRGSRARPAENGEDVKGAVCERAGDEAAGGREQGAEDRAGENLDDRAAHPQGGNVRRGEAHSRHGGCRPQAGDRSEPCERERAPCRLLAHAHPGDDERRSDGDRCHEHAWATTREHCKEHGADHETAGHRDFN
jgi:hypothetical protein